MKKERTNSDKEKKEFLEKIREEILILLSGTEEKKELEEYYYGKNGRMNID